MYDIMLNINGNIDKLKPIDAYWILFEKNNKRKEMTVLEKRAYGYTVTFSSNGYYNLILRAIPKRTIKIVMVKNNEPKAKIKINNSEAYLSRVYVFANGNFTPRVLYYILVGTDIKTGMKISEKINMK
jgi:hypothetical protein